MPKLLSLGQGGPGDLPVPRWELTALHQSLSAGFKGRLRGSVKMEKKTRDERRAYENELKDDRQRFLQQVSKKQFRTLYHSANTCG